MRRKVKEAKEAKEEPKTKKFFVAEMYSYGFMPNVKFVTDSREEAEQYATLVRRNNQEHEYLVLEQI